MEGIRKSDEWISLSEQRHAQYLTKTIEQRDVERSQNAEVWTAQISTIDLGAVMIIVDLLLLNELWEDLFRCRAICEGHTQRMPENG